MPYTETMPLGLIYSRSLRWSEGQYTFSIPTVGSTWDANYSSRDPITAEYGVFNDLQAQIFRDSIRFWDDLIAPDFVEVDDVAGPGSIRVAFSGLANNTAYAFLPPTVGFPPLSSAGDVWVWAGNGMNGLTNLFYVASFRQTMLHELGHALGLKHTFEALGYDTAFDNHRYSVMSYTEIGSNLSFLFNYSNEGIVTGLSSTAMGRVLPSTPMVMDIAAIQSLYGADPDTRSGDDVYRLDDSTRSMSAIYDAGGIDTFDLSGNRRGSRIDLTPGAYSSVSYLNDNEDLFLLVQEIHPNITSSMFYNYRQPFYSERFFLNRDNLGISFSTVIENVLGSSHSDQIRGNFATNVLAGGGGDDRLWGMGGDDVLNGGAGNDILDGGIGNDLLDGGAGFDVALYAGGRRQYTTASTATSTTVSGNGEGTDTLVSIEEARFVDGVLTFDASSASAQVMRLYSATLNRVPDQGGLEANVANLARIGLLAVANTFVASAEFQARFGALNNQQFVEQMYRFALGREGDAAGIASWVAVMNGGATRGQMVVSFSESLEHQNRTAATLNAGLWVPDLDAQVIARMYDATFDRLPDAGGLGVWTANLKAGMALIDIATAFAASAEFQQRYGTVSNEQFVRQMYQFTLNREPDAAGLASWTAALNAGTSRAQMLLNFSESAEHVALTASLWLGGISIAGMTASPLEDVVDKGIDDPFILPDVAHIGPIMLHKDDIIVCPQDWLDDGSDPFDGPLMLPEFAPAAPFEHDVIHPRQDAFVF